MNSNNANTSRLKIAAGTITFEIEGTEALIREALNYAKENILSQNIQEAVKQAIPSVREEVPTKPLPAEIPSVRDFYAEKNPGNNMEAVVILAFYAREYRDTPEVSEREIQPLFNEVEAKLPKDTAQAIRNAARKVVGYLEFTGKTGYYRITNAGVNLVNKLPRKGRKVAR